MSSPRRTPTLLSRSSRAALIGLAGVVGAATAAAASTDLAVSGAGDTQASSLPEMAVAADMSVSTLMIAPITAGAVIVLAAIALIISATRRRSGD